MRKDTAYNSFQTIDALLNINDLQNKRMDLLEKQIDFANKRIEKLEKKKGKE